MAKDKKKTKRVKLGEGMSKLRKGGVNSSPPNGAEPPPPPPAQRRPLTRVDPDTAAAISELVDYVAAPDDDDARDRLIPGQPTAPFTIETLVGIGEEIENGVEYVDDPGSCCGNCELSALSHDGCWRDLCDATECKDFEPKQQETCDCRDGSPTQDSGEWPRPTEADLKTIARRACKRYGHPSKFNSAGFSQAFSEHLGLAKKGFDGGWVWAMLDGRPWVKGLPGECHWQLVDAPPSAPERPSTITSEDVKEGLAQGVKGAEYMRAERGLAPPSAPQTTPAVNEEGPAEDPEPVCSLCGRKGNLSMMGSKWVCLSAAVCGTETTRLRCKPAPPVDDSGTGENCEDCGSTTGQHFTLHCKPTPPAVDPVAKVDYVQVVDVCPDCSGTLGWSDDFQYWLCADCPRKGTREDLHPTSWITYSKPVPGEEATTTTTTVADLKPCCRAHLEEQVMDAAFFAPLKKQTPAHVRVGELREEVVKLNIMLERGERIEAQCAELAAKLTAANAQTEASKAEVVGARDKLAHAEALLYAESAGRNRAIDQADQLRTYGAGQHAKVDELKDRLRLEYNRANRHWDKQCKVEQQARRASVTLGAEVLRWKNNTDTERGRRVDVEHRVETAIQFLIKQIGIVGGAEGVEAVAGRAAIALSARQQRIGELQDQVNRLTNDVGAILDERTADLDVQIVRMTQAHEEVISELGVSQQEVADLQGLLANHNEEREGQLALVESLMRQLDRSVLRSEWTCPQCEQPCTWEDDRWLCSSEMCGASGTRPKDDEEQPVFHGKGSIPCSKCGATSAEATLRSIGRVWSCSDEKACMGRWTRKDQRPPDILDCFMAKGGTPASSAR
ncbi:hypothetical protein LCGC14_0258070, partial [marine sediment metagenome]